MFDLGFRRGRIGSALASSLVHERRHIQSPPSAAISADPEIQTIRRLPNSAGTWNLGAYSNALVDHSLSASDPAKVPRRHIDQIGIVRDEGPTVAERCLGDQCVLHVVSALVAVVLVELVLHPEE